MKTTDTITGSNCTMTSANGYVFNVRVQRTDWNEANEPIGPITMATLSDTEHRLSVDLFRASKYSANAGQLEVNWSGCGSRSADEAMRYGWLLLAAAEFSANQSAS